MPRHITAHHGVLHNGTDNIQNTCQGHRTTRNVRAIWASRFWANQVIALVRDVVSRPRMGYSGYHREVEQHGGWRDETMSRYARRDPNELCVGSGRQSVPDSMPQLRPAVNSNADVHEAFSPPRVNRMADKHEADTGLEHGSHNSGYKWAHMGLQRYWNAQHNNEERHHREPAIVHYVTEVCIP